MQIGTKKSSSSLDLFDADFYMKSNYRVKEILTINQKTGEKLRFEVEDLIINYGYDRELKFIKESSLQIELERDLFAKGSGKAETNIAGFKRLGYWKPAFS